MTYFVLPPVKDEDHSDLPAACYTVYRFAQRTAETV